MKSLDLERFNDRGRVVMRLDVGSPMVEEWPGIVVEVEEEEDEEEDDEEEEEGEYPPSECPRD